MKISVFTYADSGCVMDGLSFMLKSTAVYVSQCVLRPGVFNCHFKCRCSNLFGFYRIQFLLSACT